MNRLKRRIIDLNGDRHWALYGVGGVISWGLIAATDGQINDGPIGVHSPRPLHNDDLPAEGCPFLENGCYVDMGFLAGERLGTAWRAADRDDAVIWRELEQWYASHLAGGTR